ncbi:hypothetical protein [Sporofaciens musculi]
MKTPLSAIKLYAKALS